MALYLKTKVHDKLLLPFPSNSKFDYISLIELANDLSQKTELSFQEFQDITRSRFEISSDQARLYFETCSLYLDQHQSTFPGDEFWALKPKLPKLVIVLFLFNQLHGAFMSQQFRNDVEFPVPLETEHDPLCVQIDKSVIEDLDSELSDKQIVLPFPSRIKDSRNQLSLFWRSNTRKWLILVFVTLYGRDHVIESHSGHNTLNFEPALCDLQFLNHFFEAVGPREGTEEFDQTITRFKDWYEKKQIVTSVSSSLAVYSFQVEQIVAYYVANGNSTSSVAFDILVHAFQYTIMDIPLSYEMLNVSSHGRVISTALHSSPLVPSEDVTNVPVLLSRKRGRTIVVEPSFTKKRNVIIHRLYDCQLFLFGAVDDVIISNCRNTTIFIPIVTGCMSVMTCSNVTITGMCTSFRIDCDSETANMQTNFAYLGTPTRPLVIHSPENDLTCSSICFAPCNKWYKGFFQDLEQHGFNTTMNLWNDPLSFTDQKLFHLLAPHQFTMTEIPFDINPVQTYAAAAEPMKKDTDDHNQFLKMLPCSYATWIVEMNTLHQKTRLIMEQATAKDPMLKTRMEKEFHNWLKQSNNIISVANLMGMQQETSD